MQKDCLQGFFRRLLSVKTDLLGQDLFFQGKACQTNVTSSVTEPLVRRHCLTPVMRQIHTPPCRF